MVRIDSAVGGGSGAIFEIQDQTAYIITNHHVVEGWSEVNVTVNDSSVYRGAVLGSDPVRDLAVVRICCGSFRALPFGDASRLEPGDEVIAIGYALGLSGQATITRGIVSAMRYDADYQSDVIQTDAAINPGNSGGPMLSVSGEILGINTFRIDESRSGRSAEGLGFAVSGTTVRQRLPDLKAGSPSPTPTRLPAPTSSFARGGGYGYGPVNGELRHDPSDGLIEAEYVDASLTDMIVFATFVNPYSAAANSWDYGFIIRDTRRHSGSDQFARFFQIAVTSQGRWAASWRDGGGSGNENIGEGWLGRFDATEGGKNYLWIAVFGDSGLLFVNGEFISELDLSDVAGAGDVAIIAGAFAGNETAGAVTRYEGFSVAKLRKAYGPASGRFRQEPGFVAEHDSGVWTKDLVAQTECVSPPGRNWDCGFIIRNPESNRLEIIGLAGDGRWFHNTHGVFDDGYTDVAGGFLPTIRSRNDLTLLAFEDFGLFFVNGQFVARLDLSHNMDRGAVSVMGGFFNNHTGEPSFANFSVWTP